MIKDPLIKFGNLPVSTSDIESCFPDLSSPEKKVQALEKEDKIIRLKRALYVVNNELTGVEINPMLCANHIYGPSYVSLRWALRWYGLIPERVYTMTSVTIKKSRNFENKIGNFSYYQVNKDYYPAGIRVMRANDSTVLIATPEKALCDFLIYDRYVPGQSQKSLLQYLEEDIRFDIDELSKFDISIIDECARRGMKQETLNNLTKLIKKL